MLALGLKVVPISNGHSDALMIHGYILHNSAPHFDYHVDHMAHVGASSKIKEAKSPASG